MAFRCRIPVRFADRDVAKGVRPPHPRPVSHASTEEWFGKVIGVPEVHGQGFESLRDGEEAGR